MTKLSDIIKEEVKEGVCLCQNDDEAILIPYNDGKTCLVISIYNTWQDTFEAVKNCYGDCLDDIEIIEKVKVNKDLYCYTVSKKGRE